MFSNKISAQDKRDLEKYIKFLALKSSQVIVQSRLGEKIYTECHPSSGQNHWVSVSCKIFISLHFLFCFLNSSLSKYNPR